MLHLAMPSNNTPFNLVHNRGEIPRETIKKPRQFFAPANIGASANNEVASGNDPCFLFLHCTKSK